MPGKTTVIISEDRSSQSARQTLQQDLAAALENRPEVEVTVIPHLYDLVPDGPGMRYLQSIPGEMVVLAWLYPRASYWVLDANQVEGRMGRSSFLAEEEPDAAPADSADKTDDVPDRTIWCLDLRAHSEAKPFLEEIRRIVVQPTGEPAASIDRGKSAAAGGETRVEETTRFRWYPVIDYSRCRNCLECLNFCLFGVFGLDESERIMVEQPDACRDGCPACSRVCPSRAIMFPHHHSPAIAGDPQAPADGFDTDLLQLFGAASPEQLAAGERDRALSEKTGSDKLPAKDDLDHLVDDLDKMDL